MKQAQTFSGILIGGAVALSATQPVWAAATQVTGVRLNPNGSQLQLILETQAGDDRPQIFTVNRGKDLVADIVNTQLSLDGSNVFRQENPMPGITSVVVSSLDTNSIRVTVSGEQAVPTGQILQSEPQGIALGISTGATSQALDSSPISSSSNNSASPSLPTLPESTLLAQTPNSSGTPIQIPPPRPAEMVQTPPPATPTAQTPVPQPVVPAPNPDVLVPNPQITIDGIPAAPAGTVQPVAPAPPFLPRAVAPPLGDIAISNIDASASIIDLGTEVRIPRLVLREAPAREVLSLLARSAGLNLAFTGDASGAQPGQPGQPGAAPGTGGPTISLDIENESVQDVFNYVLQLSGLQANRVGRTIFVGSVLPVGARNVVTRTLRLNQVTASAAANYLTAQGAETQIPIEQVQIQTIGEGAAARTVETRTPSILALRPQETTGTLLLRGLSVVSDDRLNAITLVGEPRQIEIATAMLTQLDLRRRQVAVNVKIVDVNLLGTDAFNSSFSFGIGDSFFVNDAGAASFSYGGFRPPTADQVTNSAVSPPVIQNPFAGADVFLNSDQTFTIQGADTVIIDQRPGQTPITRVPGPDIEFFTPRINLDDPLSAGIISLTRPTSDIITIDQNGNLTVTQGDAGDVEFGLPSLFQYPKRFLSALQAQITSGNGKILTDPTLVVQEGQSARVQLTQQVFAGTELVTRAVGEDSVTVEQPIIRDAGLILDIRIERIDDNGFVTLGIDPTVSAPSASQDTPVGQITLTQERTLRSGAIRLRDGQTLILAGIIQESDRTTVSKVPILGDIPILGALFRSTNRSNQRNEVIVLLTPQILDDSAGSSFGYNYTPGRESREFLQRRGVTP